MMAFKSPTYKDKNIMKIYKTYKDKNRYEHGHKCLILDNKEWEKQL